MMVISVDRWSAIIHPLEHPRRKMLTLAWLLALVCSIPGCFMRRLKTYPHLETMITDKSFFEAFYSSPNWMELLYVYDIYWYTLAWFLPLITMLGCYTSMIVHLYRRSKTSLGQHFSRDPDGLPKQK